MRASPARGRPLAVFLCIALATFAVDQLTKALAAHLLRPSAPVPLLGPWLRLNLAHNLGSAFGLVSVGWALLVAAIAVCLVILVYAARGGLTRRPGRALWLGLIFGGSVGNLADRLRTGGVVDFIDLRVWPVFNVADIAITAGFALLAVRLLRGR